MAWVAEAALPQAWTDPNFSNIVIESGSMVVYVSGYDFFAKFYRYNLDTNAWTELANPPAILYGQLAVSPDGTKVVGHGLNGTRLYIYDISTGWATSALTPAAWMISSMVWADDDTIWVNVRSIPNVKYYKYVVSTNTWTAYPNSFAPAITYGICTCISTDGTRLYSGTNGLPSHKYTIATDTYAAGPTLAASYTFIWSADRHKLWFGTHRALPVPHDNITRWLNPDTEVLEGDVFPEYAPATRGFNLAAGVYGMTMCIANFMVAAPEILSITLAGAATVTTDDAFPVGKEDATLNGTLDDDGGDTCECGFEWGETIVYGNATPTQSRTTGQTFAQGIAGLDQGKIYHFRAVATNPAGPSYGADKIFKTKSPGAGINPGLLEILNP